ncbi:hypothetical protein GCM10018793_10500 [Streptomyces sulfonofaciens]|uniref:UspA domain-containing protein n=1 Tax=Streptomyces sulfonofaciens TaxID=68272 RepID=A0A919FUW7_9ACTN|nr:universal stress protein [Streptomyces sulfonofaciens]GHH72842.1 hypothetical protein GCM10018793_10500 [Streptomyces sulfonofaciens]
MSTLPVVVAVDGSEGSLRALDWALAEAQLREAPLRLVHVRQYAAWPQPEVPVSDRPEEPAEDRVLTRVLASFSGRAGLPEVDTRSPEGDPAAVLPELGAAAQLLVLGSRGRGGFASLLLGSNGMAAARDAPCPVVVVPRPGREAPDTARAAPGPRVVVGVSVEAPDDNTLDFACAEAVRHAARLEVVCAYPRPSYAWTAAGDFTPTAEDEEAAQAATADQLDEILAPYRQAFAGLTVEPRVAPGDAAGHIVAASKDAELVVVGRHHRRMLRPARMLGSVTHAVVLHAASPIAVVPPGPEGAEAAE